MRHGYTISSDKQRLDRRAIHAFLETAYWSPGVGSQAGFARAVTDGAQFGYLADVFVLEEHRGHGLGSPASVSGRPTRTA